MSFIIKFFRKLTKMDYKYIKLRISMTKTCLKGMNKTFQNIKSGEKYFEEFNCKGEFAVIILSLKFLITLKSKYNGKILVN